MQISDPQKNTLISNAFALSIVQFFNYGFPLVIIPYLFQNLGAQLFGLTSFAAAFTLQFRAFVDYGFDLSGTRKISLNRDSPNKISKIYSTIIITKFLLAILSFLIFLSIVLIFENFRTNYLLFLFSFGIMFEVIFSPIWLYQGLEKMKFITLTQFLSKLTVAILILTNVNSPEDYLMVPAIYSFGAILSSILSIILVKFYFNITFQKPNLIDVIELLKDGFYLFISIFSVGIYRNANIFILGLVSNQIFVGYYALVEKLIKAIQSILQPIVQTFFPLTAKKFKNQSIQNSLKDLTYIFKIYLPFLIIVVFGLLFLSPKIIYFLSGNTISEMIIDLRVLSFALLFGCLNFLFGIVGLVNFGYQKYFTKSILIAGLTNILLCAALGYAFHDLGASLSLVITEVILFIMLLKKIIQLKKSK